jgi:uncharacterized membrane protein YfcA
MTTVLIAGAFLLAGLVKGVIGMGSQVVVMGVLALIMPPAEAATLLIIPSLITNFWQMFVGVPVSLLLRRFWLLSCCIFVLTVATAGVLAHTQSKVAVLGLGGAMMIYALRGLFSVKMETPARCERWLSPVIGTLTGIVTGCTGVFFLPVVPYLQSLGLEKRDLVQALGLMFTVSTVGLATGLYREGVFKLSSLDWTSLAIALIAMLAGMVIGQKLQNRMSISAFRRTFFASLVVLGFYIIIQNTS